jgi:threonine dehydrogenase-like Zn-dependent dehydrogenase
MEGSFHLPLKYGYAAVGRVRGVGTRVSTLSIGDAVFALHPHQTRFVVDDSSVIPLPPTIPTERGVFFANLETALNALLDRPVRIGERVVVLGQGTVGSLIGMLARRTAGRLVVVDAMEHRRAVARVMGADAAIAPSDRSVDELRAALGGCADIVFETSGNPAALQSAVDIAGRDATVVAVSWYGSKSVTLDLGSNFHRSRVRIQSSQVGSIAPELSPRWDFARRRATVIHLLHQLPLEQLVTHRVPFDRAMSAFDLIDTAGDGVGQVVLTYDSVVD